MLRGASTHSAGVVQMVPRQARGTTWGVALTVWPKTLAESMNDSIVCGLGA